MNTRLWSGAFAMIASLSALVVMAQTPSPSPAGANAMTIRGCIRHTTDIHAQGESSRALSDPDETTEFVLIRTRTKAADPATIYRLDDLSAAPIAPHVGHEVEISATLIDEERHGPAGATSNVTAPKVAVHSITMVASTCPKAP